MKQDTKLYLINYFYFFHFLSLTNSYKEIWNIKMGPYRKDKILMCTQTHISKRKHAILLIFKIYSVYKINMFFQMPFLFIYLPLLLPLWRCKWDSLLKYVESENKWLITYTNMFKLTLWIRKIMEFPLIISNYFHQSYIAQKG